MVSQATFKTGYPPKCREGFYGNTADNQRSEICDGLCPAGFTCPNPGTIDP